MASAPGFPQVMIHPQHKAAEVREVSSDPTSPGYGLPGAPERFPPIEVHNENQEAETRARGYLRYGEEVPKVASFSEYPKCMVHPGHVDAIPVSQGARMENGQMITFQIAGTPEKYPPVIVHDARQETAAEAKGYRLPGKSDEMAFDKANAAPGKPGDEWPKWVDGMLTQDPDAPVDLTKDYPKWLHFTGADSVLVTDPAHEKRVLAARGGVVPAAEPTQSLPYVPAQSPNLNPDYDEFLAWRAARERGMTFNPQAAHDEPNVSRETPSGDERSELLALAKERGIEVNIHWKTDHLRRMVEQAEPQAAE